MDIKRLEHWLELAGSVAILIGLGLLAVELRQTSDITRAELATGTGSDLMEINSQFATTELSTTYARMLEAPEDLTTAEMLALNGLFSEILGVFTREVGLKRHGIFDEDERIIGAIVPVYFSNSYARSWWRANRKRWPARVTLVSE